MSAAPLAVAPRLRRPSLVLPIGSGLVVAGGVLLALAIGAMIAYDPRYGIAALTAVVYVPVILVNLPLGVALWIPLAFVDVVPYVSPASLGLMALIALAWLAVLPARSDYIVAFARRNALLLWSIAALIIWITLSIAWSEDAGAAWHNLSNWYVAGATFAIVATTITRPPHLIAILLAIVAGAMLAAAVGYLPIDTGSATAQVDGRLSGGLGDPNFLAAGIVPAVALAVGLYMAVKNTTLRWCIAGALAFLLVSLAATGSRGGLVAGGISLAAAIFLARSRRAQALAIIATAVTVIGLWSFANSSGTWDRIREFDTNGTGRVDLWDVGWRMGADNPVVGVGLNNFRTRSNDYVRQPGSPADISLISEQPHVVHNVYLQQFVETGIVGLVLLLLVVFAALGTTIRAVRRLQRAGAEQVALLGRAVIVAQVGTLSALVFLSNGYDQVLWTLLALGPVMMSMAVRAEGRQGGVAQ